MRRRQLRKGKNRVGCRKVNGRWWKISIHFSELTSWTNISWNRPSNELKGCQQSTSVTVNIKFLFPFMSWFLSVLTWFLIHYRISFWWCFRASSLNGSVAWHDDMTRTGARRGEEPSAFLSNLCLLFRKASYSTHNTTLNKILKCFNNEISFRLFPISSGFNCDFDSFSCRKLFPSSPFNCVRFSIEQFSWINKNLWQACREFSISFHSSYVVLPLLSPPNKRCHRIWWLKLFLFAFESTLLPSLLYI